MVFSYVCVYWLLLFSQVSDVAMGLLFAESCGWLSAEKIPIILKLTPAQVSSPSSAIKSFKS